MNIFVFNLRKYLMVRVVYWQMRRHQEWRKINTYHAHWLKTLDKVHIHAINNTRQSILSIYSFHWDISIQLTRMPRSNITWCRIFHDTHEGKLSHWGRVTQIYVNNLPFIQMAYHVFGTNSGSHAILALGTNFRETIESKYTNLR